MSHHTLTAEEVETIKAVAKANSIDADMTFRRHYIGTAEEMTTVLLSWSQFDKITKERDRKYLEMPWTTFGITDYGNRSKQHAYGHMRNAFHCIAGLVKAGDLLQMHVTLSEHDYGYCEVWIERPNKSGKGIPKTVYRGYTDVGMVGNFIG